MSIKNPLNLTFIIFFLLSACSPQNKIPPPSDSVTNYHQNNELALLEHLIAEKGYAKRSLAHLAKPARKIAQKLALYHRQQEDPGIIRGNQKFHLKSEPGSKFPVLFATSLINSEEETRFMDPNNASFTRTARSIVGVRFDSETQNLLLLILPEKGEDLDLYFYSRGDKSFKPIAKNISGAEWINSTSILYSQKAEGSQRTLLVHNLKSGKTSQIHTITDPSIYLRIGKTADNTYTFVSFETPRRSSLWIFPASAQRFTVENSLLEGKVDVLSFDSKLFFLTDGDRSALYQLETPGFNKLKRSYELLNGWLIEAAQSFSEKMLLFERNGSKEKIEYLTKSLRLQNSITPCSTPCHITPHQSALNNSKGFSFYIESFLQPPKLYYYDFITQQIAPQFKDSQNISVHQVKPSGPYLTRIAPEKSSEPLPTLLITYGSYGKTLFPEYQPEFPILLKQGAQIGLCHTRGGGYLGKKWHQAAIQQNIHRRKEDLLSCIQYLLEENFSSQDQLFAFAKSAGATLVASTINDYPDLFQGVVFDAPFLDPIELLSNPDHPYRERDFEEWGNPKNSLQRNALQTFSPLETLQESSYPPIFITGRIGDTITPYSQILRWVKRVRQKNTGNNPLYVRFTDGGSHLGEESIIEDFRTSALRIAFLLDQL